MAVLRFRSRKFLILLVFSVVVIFTMRQQLGVWSDSVHIKNTFSGNSIFRSLFQYSFHRRTGGSRANHSFPEVDELADWYLTKQQIFDSRLTLLEHESYVEFLEKLYRSRPMGARLIQNLSDNGHSWEKFYREIDQFALYNPNENTVEDLLLELATSPIVKTEAKLEYSQGTLIVTLSNGAVGVFKGMKFGRDYQTPPDLLYFSEFDRHNAEIAAFHLDRILGFYRTPPTVGRMINVSSEVSTDPNVLKYDSPVGNSCYLVGCRQYYNSFYGFCGTPHLMEGSLAIALPGRLVPRRNDDNRHPWARTYNISKAAWEVSEDYCQTVVKNDDRFSRGRTLLDLMDMAVFDFLTGNMNRSHYERFPEFDEDMFVFHVDNAGGFSKANYDCNSCLAPVRQCCLIRQSTMVKLIKLYQGPDSLSGLLRKSLNSDPVSPILLESHLDAVDRRLGKVLKTISDCVSSRGYLDAVVIDDEF